MSFFKKEMMEEIQPQTMEEFDSIGCNPSLPADSNEEEEYSYEDLFCDWDGADETYLNYVISSDETSLTSLRSSFSSLDNDDDDDVLEDTLGDEEEDRHAQFRQQQVEEGSFSSLSTPQTVVTFQNSSDYGSFDWNQHTMSTLLECMKRTSVSRGLVETYILNKKKKTQSSFSTSNKTTVFTLTKSKRRGSSSTWAKYPPPISMRRIEKSAASLLNAREVPHNIPRPKVSDKVIHSLFNQNTKKKNQSLGKREGRKNDFESTGLRFGSNEKLNRLAAKLKMLDK